MNIGVQNADSQFLLFTQIADFLPCRVFSPGANANWKLRNWKLEIRNYTRINFQFPPCVAAYPKPLNGLFQPAISIAGKPNMLIYNGFNRFLYTAA